MTEAQRKRFTAVKTEMLAELPGLLILPDTDPGELAVWAKQEQQKVIADLLERLKGEAAAGEKYTVVSYPITAADPDNVLAMLKKLHPDVQAVLDAKNSRILILGYSTEQARIKASLEQIQAPAPPEKEQKWETYPLPNIDTSAGRALAAVARPTPRSC